MKGLKATTLFLFILALPITGAVAQQAPGLKRIGIVLATANTGSENSIYIPALQQRLSELGWKNGNNVTYQVCSAEGSTARATACVDRMVEAHTDLIITQGQFAIEAAMKRAPAIPAVFTMIADPVRLGYVPSLARPGGNVTGFAHVFDGIGGKWLQFLRRLAPGVDRVALAAQLDAVGGAWTAKDDAAASDIIVTQLAYRDMAELDQRLRSFVARTPRAGLILRPHTVVEAHHEQMVELAGRTQIADDLSVLSLGDLWWPDVLRARPARHVAPDGRLCRSYHER
jgi:putative ABC transport system substrate-binding protein